VPTGTAFVFVPATITLPNAPTTIQDLLIESSDVTINATTSTFATTFINVDSGGTLTGETFSTLNLNIPTGGVVSATDATVSTSIGDGSGPGMLNLTGGGTLSIAATGSSMAVGLGGIGIVNQSGTTAVNAQSGIFIGSDGNVSNPVSLQFGGTMAAGGTGTYTLSGTATLSSGTNAIAIGAGSGLGGGTGTGGTSATLGILNITSTSATALTAGAIYLGVDANANTAPEDFATGIPIANTMGIVNQSAGTATISGTVFVGFAPGTRVSGAYNLSGTGILNTGGITIGDVTGSSGSFQQLAGTTVGTNTLIVGDGGQGTYSLQGGTLTVGTNLTIGSSAGGNGTLTQSGGTLILNGTFNIGTGSTGIFNYNGGALTLSASGIAIGATGAFNQNASITITSAQPVSIATGGVYNLNSGGTLSTGGATSFTGTGNFNFAGGTVAVTGTAWSDPFNGVISGTSTINTTGGGATLSGNLTGSGTLDILGGQTVTLSGTNNVADSWGAALTGGSTLTATSAASLSTTGTYTIGAGSTFNVATTANTTFGGNISDTADATNPTPATPAQFNLTGAHKLTLAGQTNLSVASASTIGTGASLEVNQGTISNVNGSAGNAADTFDVGNGTSTGTVTLLGTTNTLPTVTVNTGSTLIAGNLTGNATVHTGATLFTGSMTGNATVNAGAVMFANNVTGSVTNNGTLGAPGSILGAAVPAPLLSSAPLLISNNLTSTGTLAVNSGNTNSTGTIVIGSFGSAAHPLTTATLSGIIDVTGFGQLTAVPIVYTTGGVTIGGNGTLNNAGGLATNPATIIFSSSLSTNGTQLLLSTVITPLTTFATTPNQNAVGVALDNLAQTQPVTFGNNFSAFGNLTTAASISTALEELTPESLQYSRNISFEDATFLAERLDGICADLHGGSTGLDTNGISVFAPGFDSSLGRSLGSLLAYSPFHSSAPNGVNYYPAGDDSSGYPSSAPLSPPASSSSPTSDSSGQTISDSPIQLRTSSEAPVLRTPRISGFIAADITLADLNQNQSATNAPSSKASYTSGDALMGISFRMTPHLYAGVLFDYNHTDAKTDSSGSKTLVDTYSPGVFATYSSHGFYANGLFAFGLNNYSNTRNISFLGTTATSSPTGQQYVTNLDCGYDFHPGPAWALGPIVGLTYTHLDIDSFTETGAGGADLSVNSQSVDSLRSRLGGHLAYQTHTGNVLFQPNVTAMWQHEYLNDNNGITSQFNIPGSTPFTIQAASASKDSALIGCGVTATLDNSMALYLNYLADVGGNDYFTQSVIGGFKANF
jgi:uncharacterized protein with beta-barrel porin domain